MKLSTNTMNIEFTGWFGFWMFMVLYIFIESIMFFKGYDTFFWRHTTDAEIQLQQKQIEKAADAR